MEPQSLYEDQLRLRIARNSVQSSLEKTISPNRISVYPNPSVSGVLNIESVYEMDSYQLYNLAGQVIAENHENQGNCFGIHVQQKGFYILKVTVSGETISQKVVVN